MKRILLRFALPAAILTAAFATVSRPLIGQSTGQPSTKNGEWPMYTADLRGSKYSPLDQIDATNFNKLEVAWRFKTDNLGPRPENKLEGTPIMVGGMLYTTGGTRRAVVALDARTGELKWVYGMDEGARAAAVAAPALGPRRLLLDRRQGRRAHRLRHDRLSAGRAEREDRPAGRVVRQERHRRPEGRRRHRQGQADRSREGRNRPALHADRRQRHDHRRLVDVRGPRLPLQHEREGPRPRVRREDRQADLALQHDSVSRRVRQRHLGERIVGVDRQQRRVDADHRRSGSRPRLPAGRVADDRRVRRQPAGQQPVRREPRRRRPEDRRDASGTSSSCTIRSGITTSRRRRC